MCIKTDSIDLRYLTKPAYLKGLFMPDPDDKTVPLTCMTLLAETDNFLKQAS